MKYTPEARASLIGSIQAGLTYEDAARAAGISMPTLKLWLKKGHDGDPEYAGFAIAFDAARKAAKEQAEPMDEEELFRVVSEAARRGSVQAMKLRWEMILADRDTDATEEPEEDKPLASVDSLAERRRA